MARVTCRKPRLRFGLVWLLPFVEVVIGEETRDFEVEGPKRLRASLWRTLEKPRVIIASQESNVSGRGSGRSEACQKLRNNS